MNPQEAARVARKILPWISRLNAEHRIALETLIAHAERTTELADQLEAALRQEAS